MHVLTLFVDSWIKFLCKLLYIWYERLVGLCVRYCSSVITMLYNTRPLVKWQLSFEKKGSVVITNSDQFRSSKGVFEQRQILQFIWCIEYVVLF